MHAVRDEPQQEMSLAKVVSFAKFIESADLNGPIKKTRKLPKALAGRRRREHHLKGHGRRSGATCGSNRGASGAPSGATGVQKEMAGSAVTETGLGSTT